MSAKIIQTQTFAQRLGAKLSTLWEQLNQVPTCRACNGTGEPRGKYKNLAEPVYWKGKLVWVCHSCKGAGKV